MDIAQRIREALAAAFEAHGIAMSSADIPLDFPGDMAHGDYATGVALQKAKEAGMSPRELAEKIVAGLGTIEGVAKIEVAGPGFINFTLAQAAISGVVAAARAAEWGMGNTNLGRRILFEHSSPNLFKPFHIGHLVNNAIGESLVRLLRNSSAEVTTISYPSDISPGIAKAVWYLSKSLPQGDEAVEAAGLGAAYAAGVQAYDSDPTVKAEVDDITKQLYTKTSGKFLTIYEHGKQQSLDYFETQVKRLGSRFDGGFIFESESEQRGVEIVKEHTPDVFVISDGAYVFMGSQYGLFDNVFVNSAGFATYLGKDIGLLDIKFSKFVFDESVTITDIEQKPHFLLLRKAAELIRHDWSDKSRFVHHGRLQFAGGKVSSRFGNVPLLEDLIAEVKEKIHERMVSAGRVEGDAIHQTLEDVAIGALKFAILRSNPGMNITFDFDRATSVEGDSGPYLQYAYARTQAILAKAQEQGVAPKADEAAEPNAVARLLVRFPAIAERAAREYAPHHVAQYLLEMAGAFNSWYAQEQILDGTEAAAHKVAITVAVGNTLKQGLSLLGIPAPERM